MVHYTVQRNYSRSSALLEQFINSIPGTLQAAPGSCARAWDHACCVFIVEVLLCPRTLLLDSLVEWVSFSRKVLEPR